MDVLLLPETNGFVVGSSNSIFKQHSTINLDVVVDVRGSLKNNYFSDRLWNCTEITKSVLEFKGKESGFEGSDDDVRKRLVDIEPPL